MTLLPEYTHIFNRHTYLQYTSLQSRLLSNPSTTKTTFITL